MGLLDKLRKKREQPKVDVDVARSQLISDAEEILRILKNSPHPSSMDFVELRYHFYRHRGMSGGEQRILDALKMLKSVKAINWGGNRGDQICFVKTLMPVRLQGLVKK